MTLKVLIIRTTLLSASILMLALTPACTTAHKSLPVGTVTSLDSLGDNARLSVKCSSGKSYQLQKSQSLTSPAWKDVGGPVMAAGDSISLVDSNATDRASFYRIIPLD